MIRNFKRYLLGFLLGVAFTLSVAKAGTVVDQGQPSVGHLGWKTQGSAANGGTNGTAGNPIPVCGTDGTNCREIATDASGDVKAVGPTAAGAASTTSPVQTGIVDGSGNVRKTLGDANGNTNVVGPTAAGVASATNPDQVGGVVFADGAPTAGVAGNVAKLGIDVQGRVFVRTYAPNFWSCTQSGISATTTCQAAPGANLSLYLTDIWLANGTTTVSTINVITAVSGANCSTTPSDITPPTALASNAGAGSYTTFNFQTPIKVTANQQICCKTAGATAFSCMVSGFIAP